MLRILYIVQHLHTHAYHYFVNELNIHTVCIFNKNILYIPTIIKK